MYSDGDKEKELGGKRGNSRNQPFTHQAHHQNRDRRETTLLSQHDYNKDAMQIKTNCRKTSMSRRSLLQLA